MTEHNDGTIRLQQAIAADALIAGCAIGGLEADSHSIAWCSAGCDGTRHHLHFQALPSPSLDDWLTTLDSREWQVPGLLVVDLAATRNGDRLILTAVTLDSDRA